MDDDKTLSASTQRGGSGHRALERLAKALDCSVEDFNGNRSPPLIGDLSELVRLWHATLDEAGRSRILLVAYQEAARFLDPKVTG